MFSYKKSSLTIHIPWGLPGLDLFSGRMVYCTSRNDVYNNNNVYKKECMGTYLTMALDEELGVLAWNHAKEIVPEVPSFFSFFCQRTEASAFFFFF